ncbi:hypothetical protein LN893_11435 [Pontibacter sp. XAAS-A31]|nr:hypothetical protein [Pontibacter harenae]
MKKPVLFIFFLTFFLQNTFAQKAGDFDSLNTNIENYSGFPEPRIAPSMLII